MKHISSCRRKTAWVLLLVWSFNLVHPCLTFALTSGPSQPESKGFQPAGVSDMVDLFSGDFKYNIPLFDVGGYPINLNYQSGSGMDDEASWVGLGWNINVGAINRQLRGNPDDFSGDSIVTEHFTKPKITVGGKARGKIELRGKDGKGKTFKIGKKKIGYPSGTVSIGIFTDNYTGIGAEIGANAGLSFSLANSGHLTAGLGLQGGISSNTSKGAEADVDVSPNVNLSIGNNTTAKITATAGVSASLGYNSRSGMKGLTLGSSFGGSGNQTVVKESENGIKSLQRNGSAGYTIVGSTISYNTEPISPKIQIPYKTTYSSFSVDLGGTAFGIFGGGGGTGYQSIREVESRVRVNNAYGFLYAERGKSNPKAVMDFIREKENPIIPELPNLAVPVHTPDIFSYTSQAGGGQFRVYRGATGILFDNEISEDSYVNTLGADAGIGGYAHGGVTKFDQNTKNTSQKWEEKNSYLPNGDFQEVSSNSLAEHAYFKQVGEKNVEDLPLVSSILGTRPLALNLENSGVSSTFRDNNTFGALGLKVGSALAKNGRQIKRTVISHLTAAEAAKGGLDKLIYLYPFNDRPTKEAHPIDSIIRTKGYRKAHHISEFSVTGDDGKRLVYGVPVYNIMQEEYSFAIGREGKDYERIKTNQTALSIKNGGIDSKKGIDHYFHKETIPAYATSYLLTAVLSPDYIDKTSNGISPDDAGTAIKFNYSKLPYNYRWRTPYENATVNRSLLADPDDDKGSIVYGEKEIFYISSIESKTMVAYFITEDRDDAVGVAGWQGGRDLSQRLKRLKEIKIYSKANLSEPLKTIEFKYRYELCKGLPNAVNDTTGKLTLERIYFLNGSSGKGESHPYIFHYNRTVSNQEISYQEMSTDRWGIFKKQSDNLSAELGNDEFPYTNQNDRSKIDEAASLWQLNKIELPTGGTIEAMYESDDYAFVQNKKAMCMTKVSGLIDRFGQLTSSLKEAKGVRLEVEDVGVSGVQTGWFKKNYLNNSDYLYTKTSVKVSTKNAKSDGKDYEFISCYAKVNKVVVQANKANVFFENIMLKGTSLKPFRNYVNPIIHAAYQTMKNDYPRYAYPGFENKTKGTDAVQSFKAAITAVFNAAKNLSELKESFYQKAYRKDYASEVNLNKTFVKLVRQDGFKLGGGLRVKSIKLNDNWGEMTGDSNSGTSRSYGQAYDYTTVYDNKIISSGVATYEPSVGCDENPWRQHVPYVQRIKGALNNFYCLEEPFCESFFPTPSVGYSKVTIRDLGVDGLPDAKKSTGYIVNEFFTAKDFPTRVDVLDVQKYEYKPRSWFSIAGGSSIHEVALSQGYAVTLNDMHGKSKAVRVYNKSGGEISSTEYYYNVEDSDAEELRLKNVVDVIDDSGILQKNKIIGRDVEFFTDLREQRSLNVGKSINIGADLIPVGWAIPFPLPHFPINKNTEYRLFRSACAVKVVQYFGVLDKVIKKENGSSISTENIAYDGNTGEPLITRTQNEFNEDIYSLNVPAYWMYKTMGPAYHNLGIVLSKLQVSNYEVSAYGNILTRGDELLDVNTGLRYWVTVQNGKTGLIDKDGQLIANTVIQKARIILSGFRNLLQLPATTLVSLVNPVQNGKLDFSESAHQLKVINASAVTYDEEWATENEAGDNSDPNSKYLVENTSGSFTFSSRVYSSKGAYLDFHTATDPGPLTISPFWGIPGISATGPFKRSGIWLTNQGSVSLSGDQVESLSFDTCITVPETRDYYVGAGTSGELSFYFDQTSNGNSFSNFENRWLLTKHHLTAGKHHLNVTVFVHDNNPKNDYAALEIYSNSLAELKSDITPTIIFSTAGIANKRDLKSVRTRYLNGKPSSRTYHYLTSDGEVPDACFPYSSKPVAKRINPYLHGYLGNWNLYQTKVFQGDRHSEDVFNASKKGINVKNAGYVENFVPFWTRSVSGWKPSSSPQWVTANSVTLYDEYGQQLENKDALGRFSSAQFSFRGQVPSAIAANAMNREVYNNSFEDYSLEGNGLGLKRDFSNTVIAQKNLDISNKESHSGHYSLSLPSSGIQLGTSMHSNEHRKASYLDFIAQTGYMTKVVKGLYPIGFEPVPGKKYIFNSWVKDDVPGKGLAISLLVNGSESPLKCKAVVEGWKLLEGSIDLKAIKGKDLLLSIVPSASNVFLDDIRIFPFDSHVKSYVYDDQNYRLMAELDENCFATYYEYDDEGSLVRVKKETEKGVVTLKESRSSYRKRTL